MERIGVRKNGSPTEAATSAPVRQRCINCRRSIDEHAAKYPTLRIRPWLCEECRLV